MGKSAIVIKCVRLRRESGLSGAAMARRAGVSYPTLKAFEAGKKIRGMNTAKLIPAYESCKKVEAVLPPAGDGDDGKNFHNAEWLRAQVRAFVSDNDLTIVELGRSGMRSIVMTHDQVFEFGRIILLAVGKNVV